MSTRAAPAEGAVLLLGIWKAISEPLSPDTFSVVLSMRPQRSVIRISKQTNKDECQVPCQGFPEWSSQANILQRNRSAALPATISRWSRGGEACACRWATMRWIMGKTVTFKGREEAAPRSTYSRRRGRNEGFYSSNLLGKQRTNHSFSFLYPSMLLIISFNHLCLQ